MVIKRGSVVIKRGGVVIKRSGVVIKRGAVDIHRGQINKNYCTYFWQGILLINYVTQRRRGLVGSAKR